MSTLSKEQLRNITEHVLAIDECMRQARETLSHDDYMKFLQVLSSATNAEGELREMMPGDELRRKADELGASHEEAMAEIDEQRAILRRIADDSE